MNLIKGLMAGIIAGVVGALLWAGIAYYANVEIGYLAWGIGALVGFAISAASSGGGAAPGLAAILITVLSICGGKYVGSYWMMEEVFSEVANIGADWTDTQYVSAIANNVLEDEQNEGKYSDFQFNEEAEAADYYPPEVWANAEEQWGAMSSAEKETFKVNRLSEVNDAVSAMRGTLAWESFMASFGPIDIVFFILGVVTAGKLAFSDVIEE